MPLFSDDGDDGSDHNDYIDDIDDIWVGSFMDHHVGLNSRGPDQGGTEEHNDSNLNHQTFEGLLDNARCPLYPSCTQFSKLSFIVKLLYIKTIGGWTVKSFNTVLKLLKAAFPNVLLPDSYTEAHHLERGLGFSYIKLHVCLKDCVLFWKDYIDKDECPKCNSSRWIPRIRK